MLTLTSQSVKSATEIIQEPRCYVCFVGSSDLQIRSMKETVGADCF